MPKGAPCLAQSAERQRDSMRSESRTYGFMLGGMVTVVVAVWIIETSRSTAHGCFQAVNVP